MSSTGRGGGHLWGRFPKLVPWLGGALKRIAAPLVGGLATSFLLELTVYPAIFAIWKGRSLKALPAREEVTP